LAKAGLLTKKERAKLKWWAERGRVEDFDTNFPNCSKLKCAEGTTEISPRLKQGDYLGKTSHKTSCALKEGVREFGLIHFLGGR
jgi:hypothetical protein